MAPSDNPGRTLLVGCGRIGTRLGEGLVAAGGEVTAIRRDTAGLPDTFTSLALDLREPVGRELPEVDAMVITLTPGMNRSPVHPTGYTDALEHLATALPSLPPRVLFVSSTRVFEGSSGYERITERDTPTPVTPRGRALREGELRAADLFGAHILRPAGIYGPGREMMIRKVLEQTPVQYAKRSNRIHAVDLVRILGELLGMAAPPQLLHAVDRRPATVGEVVTFIAERLGLQPPPALPAAPGGTVLDGGLLKELLGPLRYPTFEAGYGELLAGR